MFFHSSFYLLEQGYYSAHLPQWGNNYLVDHLVEDVGQWGPMREILSAFEFFDFLYYLSVGVMIMAGFYVFFLIFRRSFLREPSKTKTYILSGHVR